MLTLSIYFALLLSALLVLIALKPDALSVMPFGGNDVFELTGFESSKQSLMDVLAPTQNASKGPDNKPASIGLLALYLALSLAGTIIIMLPIAWTYSAIKRETGYRKSFARALLVLPICATTVVLLIQNNLALALGLAAMVTAIRFRVALEEAIDGIFVFAAVCVGLAAGIGYLGVAAIMAVFFCFTNAVLWKMEFGKNPLDDARAAKKNAKLKRE